MVVIQSPAIDYPTGLLEALEQLPVQKFVYPTVSPQAVFVQQDEE